MTRGLTSPNQITGASAGGPSQLAIRTRWAARIAPFQSSAASAPSMKERHVLRWLTVSVVALFAALLAFIGYEVFSTVLPSDAIVITAADGASLRVDGRALEVLAGHAGTASFSPLLLPVAASLFAVLAVFALIGAASLFRHERQITHAA